MTKRNDGMSHDSAQEDLQLVQDCLKGVASAQELLFKKYYRKMLGVCLRYTNNEDEAKDVLQEGFVRVFQKLSQFASTAPFEAWVRRIMINASIDFYRKRNTVPIFQEIDAAHQLPDADDTSSSIDHQLLLAILKELPTGYRTVFNMYVVEGFSHKEIADELGISEGTSKSQLAKAKAYLRKLLTARNIHSHE